MEGFTKECVPGSIKVAFYFRARVEAREKIEKKRLQAEEEERLEKLKIT